MIRILDAAMVGRIAAGEVVERPSSVAKEWLKIRWTQAPRPSPSRSGKGGESYLRVTDNGCGIPPGEVRLAFENHATSKLRRMTT
jgi:DNA mismatch repair protein MutL